MQNHSLKVINPAKLGTDKIPAELIALEGNYNYKPNIGVMPDGELLMLTLHEHYEEPCMGGRYTIHTVMYRSRDGGRSWSRGQHLRFFGHEPSITIIDDVIFVLTHFCSNPGHEFEAFADVTRSRGRFAGRVEEAVDHLVDGIELFQLLPFLEVRRDAIEEPS